MSSEAPRVAAGELAAVQAEGEDLGLGDADLDAAPDEPGIERVVVGLKPQVRVGTDARDPASIDIRRDGWQRGHRLAFLEQAIDRATAQRSVRARVGLREPAIELELE